MIRSPVIVHVNGQLVPRSEARISPFDRGFIWGEGVYEGLRAVEWRASERGARILGIDGHVRRMQRGLDAAGIGWDAAKLGDLSLDLLEANNRRDALVYWQVTGGTPGAMDAPRHRVPPKDCPPTVFGFCSPQPPLEELSAPMTKRVISCRDPRWEFGWLKSTSLMGNVWMARRAAEAGADEAIMIRGGDEEGRGGLVAEGLAVNVILVHQSSGEDARIATPSLESAPMLRGVTRDILLDLAPEIVERPVRAEELPTASEILLIGTTTYVSAVVELNGRPVGNGRTGPVARDLMTRLMDCYRQGRDIARSPLASRS